MCFFSLEWPVRRGHGGSELAFKHLAMFSPAIPCAIRQMLPGYAFGEERKCEPYGICPKLQSQPILNDELTSVLLRMHRTHKSLIIGSLFLSE